MKTMIWKTVAGVSGAVALMAFADIAVSDLAQMPPALFGWRCLFGGLVGMFAAVIGLARNGEAVK